MVKLRPWTLEKPVDVGADLVVEVNVVFDVDEIVLEVVVNVEEAVVVAIPRYLVREMECSSSKPTWNTLAIVGILICTHIS